jgi:sensor domain CHASE-containing protein
MKLRTKTLLVIFTVCTIFFILMTSMLHIIIMNSFSNLEDKIVSDRLKRVLNQFDQEYTSLLAVGYDWSAWSDTYYFIENQSEDYIQSNLYYDGLKAININFMLFYNQTDNLIFSKAYDFQQEEEIALPAELYSYIYDNKELLLHHYHYNNSHVGIVLYNLKQTPLLLSSTPILKNNGEGPIDGTLITGRFLNNDRLQYFENITQLSISISPLLYNSSSILSHDTFLDILRKETYIQPVNNTFIAGYSVMDDISGVPVLLLEVGSNRDVYNQGFNVLQNAFIFLFITTIFLIIVTIVVLDKFVTSRLTLIGKSVGTIQNFEDLSKQIDIVGTDEISILGKNINVMLNSLKNLWAMKDAAEFSLQQKIEELERFKTITIDREIKMIELKKQLNDLMSKSKEKL